MSDGEIRLNSSNEHSTLSWFKRTLGNEYTVYRCGQERDRPLLKRQFFNAGFNPSEQPWLTEIHTSVPEYTMEQLGFLVGHSFKIVK